MVLQIWMVLVKKIILLTLVILAAALCYLSYAHLSGGAVPTLGLPLGGEKAKIRHRAHRFFEHIMFKDTKALMEFVDKDTSQEQLITFVGKTMGADPQNVDLTFLKIEAIELDSNKKRARVRVALGGQDLTTKSDFAVTKVIFLYLSESNGWLLDTQFISP